MCLCICVETLRQFSSDFGFLMCFTESRLSLLCQYLWWLNDQPLDLMAVPGVHPNLSPVFLPLKKIKKKSEYNCMVLCKMNSLWMLCFWKHAAGSRGVCTLESWEIIQCGKVMLRNPNFCLVPVAPRSVVVGAWLGLVWMILLAQTIRNCPVPAGAAGARGWLCICPWHKSQHSGDWAVAGSSSCSSGVWPLHSPAPHGSSTGALAQILHHSTGLCLWGFLLGWLGETRDRNKGRMNWGDSDFFVPPLVLLLLLHLCCWLVLLQHTNLILLFPLKEVRVFWMLSDMESSSLLGIFLLLMCYIHSSWLFSYSGSTSAILPLLAIPPLISWQQ